MKKLNQFQQFNFAAWQTGKKFMVSGVKFNEKKDCVSLDVVIVEDNTDYGDDSVTNPLIIFFEFLYDLTLSRCLIVKGVLITEDHQCTCNRLRAV